MYYLFTLFLLSIWEHPHFKILDEIHKLVIGNINKSLMVREKDYFLNILVFNCFDLFWHFNILYLIIFFFSLNRFFSWRCIKSRENVLSLKSGSVYWDTTCDHGKNARFSTHHFTASSEYKITNIQTKKKKKKSLPIMFNQHCKS